MALVGAHLEKTVFIVSTGRTGTAAIASYLNQGFMGVQAFHEPKPSLHLRLASNAFQAGRLSDRSMIALLAWTRRRLCARVRGPVYVEANPYLYGFVEFLPRVFSRPRFVHIIRDPRTFVRSVINFGSFRGVKRIVGAWLPYWLLNPEQVEPSVLSRATHLTHIERSAWRWRFFNERLERAGRLYGDDYLCVRFEDLFCPDGSGIRQLAAWIGVSEIPGQLHNLLTRKVNESTGNEIETWDSWSEADKQCVLTHCRELMARYGYLG